MSAALFGPPPTARSVRFQLPDLDHLGQKEAAYVSARVQVPTKKVSAQNPTPYTWVYTLDP